ncbi:MAG: FAD binding domain-containing protein [Candidatus Bipolaricaulota bacterium]
MRLRGVIRYHRARDTEEALSLLASYAGAGHLLAGGVDLARSPRTDIEGLIDITSSGLSGVELSQRGGLHIGAATTLGELVESSTAGRYCGGILPEVLREFSAPPLRNMATLGGAVVSAHPWADVPTLLVALGAEVRWTDGTERTVPLEEVYAGAFRNLFRRAVLTEIRLPPCRGGYAFWKLRRCAADVAMLNAACGIGLREGRVEWAQVGVGATPSRGHRLPWLEELVQGEVPGEGLWEEVSAQVSAKLDTSDDRRVGAKWRRKAAGPLVARTLARAAERANR